MNPIYPLLGLLLDGDRHGYGLKRTVDREFSPFWKIDFAQLYRSLAKMSQRGWVRVRVTSGRGGPERKIHTLTARGRAEFRAWLREPAHERDEFLVKTRLAAAARFPVSQLIEPQRTALEQQRAARTSTCHAARAEGDASRLVFADAALRETEAAVAALDLFAAITPRTKAATQSHGPIAIIGSDDPLLARLAHLAHASTRVVGSLNGLLALAQHDADMAGIHLRDAETGEYNVPFIQRLVPEEEIVLVNLAARENGLIVARGNPKNIRGIRDLARRGVSFINRQGGTGTRLLIHSKLRAARIDPHSVRDWERVAATHDGVAAAIATGAADVGAGLRASALAWGLDFIPLCEERYDLALTRASWESPRFRPILKAMHSLDLKYFAAELSGYDLTRCGRVVARIK
jgi:molybdate-binding protein/DNA-binding PadR family transcriptional regulator